MSEDITNRSKLRIVSPTIRLASEWSGEDPDVHRIWMFAKEIIRYLDVNDDAKEKVDWAADRMLDKLQTSLVHYQSIQSPAFSSVSLSQRQAAYEGLYGDLWSFYTDRLRNYLDAMGYSVSFLYKDDKRFETDSAKYIACNPNTDAATFVDFMRKQRVGWQNAFGNIRNAHEHDGNLRDLPDYDNTNDAKRLFAQVCWTAETIIGTLGSYKLLREWNVIDTNPKSTVFDRKDRFIIEHALQTMQAQRPSTRHKKRVQDQGEVLTDEREVTAMLDLVKNETERIDARFLEPACGNGNFLAPILERKLAAVEKMYKKSQLEYERNVLMAIGSIYGVDIMNDNVRECRERLYKIFEAAYMSIYKKKSKISICLSAKAILKRNILWGDALSLKTADPDNPKPIVFSEWSRPFNDSRIKRHDYDFEEIVTKDEESLLKLHKVSDLGEKVFQVRPIKSYPLIHITKIGDRA